MNYSYAKSTFPSHLFLLFNSSLSLEAGVYGYNYAQKKNTPSKVSQKSGVTPTNLNQTHNTTLTTKAMYFPVDGNFDLSSVKVNSFGRLTPNGTNLTYQKPFAQIFYLGQRTKSANRTREPSYSGIMYKAKKSVENIYNDRDASALLDLDFIGNTKSIKHLEKSKSRENINAKTWNESRISAMRPSENVSNTNSIHMRPPSPRARDTDTSMDATDRKTQDEGLK